MGHHLIKVCYHSAVGMAKHLCLLNEGVSII